MIKRLLFLNSLLLCTVWLMANTIVVKNIDELNAANKNAKPGDIIILQNGEWKNVNIKLNCNGTREKHIVFRAQTAGKVMITGHSKLMLGGNFITVEGFYFTNGFAGEDAVITFRIDKNQLANHCRVTNSVIDDFNNPKRMDENYWVAFYGKNNRLDHCSFRDKKNLGVLLAVILDDDRSRENYHSIDHNYFGRRPPLASNGGEIIRVGVSQHCQFNSFTQITNNFFEHCDGETEVVSIKSGSNRVQNNIFKESQGSLVLRHGDNNIVAGNLFLGNDKPATGGVRVINKGQMVQYNIFYKCRGLNFKAPLAVMNGIPNSPVHRYVQVTEAHISDNIFYECSPLSFCEGSDQERSLPPDKVLFADNIIYNSRDTAAYTISDDISGIRYENNKISQHIKQQTAAGFQKTNFTSQRFVTGSFSKPLYADLSMIPSLVKKAMMETGATWFAKTESAKHTKTLVVNCAKVEEVYAQLENKNPVIIRLTGSRYHFSKPLVITKNVEITGNKNVTTHFSSEKIHSVFIVSGNGNLVLNNCNIDGKEIRATNFISGDSNGSSNHYNLSIRNSMFQNFTRKSGCENLLYAFKSMVADSIIFRNNAFFNSSCNFLVMAEEKDDKGYYNAENIFIGHNYFNKINGRLLNIYRGGNDESTLGPALVFSHNKINDCITPGNEPLMELTGVQVTEIFSNQFSGCNPGADLIVYKDIVRANHRFENNIMSHSGAIRKNRFVTEKGNRNQSKNPKNGSK